MDGSRGATGAVDVGVSHLNMNINVIGGGHGLGSGLTSGGDKGTAGGESSSSSPPVGECSRQRRARAAATAGAFVIRPLYPGFSHTHLPHQKKLSLSLSRSKPPSILYLPFDSRLTYNMLGTAAHTAV